MKVSLEDRALRHVLEVAPLIWQRARDALKASRPLEPHVIPLPQAALAARGHLEGECHGVDSCWGEDGTFPKVRVGFRYRW